MVSPNPTLFESRAAAEPYRRGQWDNALKATPHSPRGDVADVRAFEPTARSGAHGFRSRCTGSLLTVLNYCRIRISSQRFDLLKGKSIFLHNDTIARRYYLAGC
jgi:hypothetical protein